VRFGEVPLAEAEGAILAHSRKVGKQTFKKGRVLSAEDVAALREAGVEPDPALAIQDLHTETLAEAAVLALVHRPQPPTALFTSQNLVTIGAVRALRRLGLHRSVALIGFDDFPLADLLDPAVTVVAQDPATMGRTAAQALFRRIDGDTSPPQEFWIPTRLIRRGSGELPPGAGTARHANGL